MAPEAIRGKPRVYFSHATNDRVLDIDLCSRSLVRRLRERGYGVEYREFDGAHGVPPEVASEAARWFLQARPRP
jgi:phospholipase/carboxylesterase